MDVDPPDLFNEQPPGQSPPVEMPRIANKKKLGFEFWAAIFVIIMGLTAAEHSDSDIIPGLIIIGGIVWLLMDRFYSRNT